MVPLTSSLYVAGVLDPKEKVLVDIGTSFFVGKSAADAKELLAKKAAQLKENTETLFRVINSKRENLETVQQAVEAKQRAS
jgi:prefoldin alpha subunit